MSTFLVILALIAAVASIVMINPATTGVGLMAGACFFVILARMAQAYDHHTAIKARLEEHEERLRTQMILLSKIEDAIKSHSP
jgi:uncharacterized membrane protein